MKHTLINTGSYLLVVSDVDHKMKWYLDDTNAIRENVVEDEDYWSVRKDYKKIIAHLPINSPILEGVDLLPPTEQEDDASKESLLTYPVKDFWVGSNPSRLYDENAKERRCFEEGYNKAIEAKEKYKYTEEDLGLFLEYVRDNYTGMGAPYLVHNKGGQRKTKAIVQDYIQSLSQPNMPVAFKCETEKVFGVESPDFSEQPKTTTNSQGQTVLIGRYIYE